MSVNDADETKKTRLAFFPTEKGLDKTRARLSGGLQDIFLGAKTLDDELLEEIETILLSADVGVRVTQEILDELANKMNRKELSDSDAVLQHLKDHLTDILKPVERSLTLEEHKPFVILMVGVNGAGKLRQLVSSQNGSNRRVKRLCPPQEIL